MLHGAQQGVFDLDFAIPSECADRLERGDADIGIVPCAEIPRLGLNVIPGTGIACSGPVRSILLVSRVPFHQIQTLAADASSRTSVMLVRIILSKVYGVEPAITSMPPDLPSMLEAADAALIIGDPALQIEPGSDPFHVSDLGEEWVKLTGLPMVFAVWAARAGIDLQGLPEVFRTSFNFGRDHMDDIVRKDAPARGISETLAREYLTEHIKFELGEREYEGMRLFLQYAAEIGSLNRLGTVKV